MVVSIIDQYFDLDYKRPDEMLYVFFMIENCL